MRAEAQDAPLRPATVRVHLGGEGATRAVLAHACGPVRACVVPADHGRHRYLLALVHVEGEPRPRWIDRGRLVGAVLEDEVVVLEEIASPS